MADKDTKKVKRTKAEENETIYGAFSLLIGSGRKLSVAESFTGGLISSYIVAFPGASKFFYEGAVCYSEEAKGARLGVRAETLKKHTAVSADAAYEMALGLLRDDNADMVLATTGYAGPDAPRPDDVGRCFIAVGDRARVHIYKFKFGGGRESIMRRGAVEAFALLSDLLKKSATKKNV